MSEDRDSRIRRRAYEIWEERGRREGSHAEHWEQATRELGAERNDDPVEGSRETIEKELARGEQTGAQSGGDGDFSPNPKMSGAPGPAADTSKSRVANRDKDGPRKAGMTPRPTEHPLGE